MTQLVPSPPISLCVHVPSVRERDVRWVACGERRRDEVGVVRGGGMEGRGGCVCGGGHGGGRLEEAVWVDIPVCAATGPLTLYQMKSHSGCVICGENTVWEGGLAAVGDEHVSGRFFMQICPATLKMQHAEQHTHSVLCVLSPVFVCRSVSVCL